MKLTVKVARVEELPRQAFAMWYRVNRKAFPPALQQVIDGKLKEKGWTTVVVSDVTRQKNGKQNQTSKLEFK